MAEHYGAKREEAFHMPLERGMPLTGGLLCGCECKPCTCDANARPSPVPTDSRAIGRPLT